MLNFVRIDIIMSTVVIDVDDKSSAKLFLELAKKMHFKARVLSDEKKEDTALLAIMRERAGEDTLPVESAINLLKKTKYVSS